MAVPVPASVHVGDVGTMFKAKIQDNGEPFDPSGASVKQLIFLDALGTAYVRNATVVAESPDWYLTYTTVAGDIVDGMHATPGTYSWQGYIQTVSGQKWHTNIGTYVVGRNLN